MRDNDRERSQSRSRLVKPALSATLRCTSGCEAGTRELLMFIHRVGSRISQVIFALAAIDAALLFVSDGRSISTPAGDGGPEK